ncbi:MAG TPA: hypothetical protein VGJ05_05650 [Fimbriiglobus sp.]|jgi:hypothetical protein
MPAPHRPWDEEEEDATPYEVSGEALPSRKDAVRDMDVGDEVVARPRRKKAELAGDGAAEEAPVDEPVRKRKRKKRRDIAVHNPNFDDIRDKENERREWIITVSLFCAGFVLTIIGAIGVSGKKDFADVKAVTLIVTCLLGVVISIPVVLVGLAVGGSIIGIEYGTPVSAFRNIAAITMFCDGLGWVGLWVGMPMLMQVFSMLVAFALFMSRFQLDVWELWASAIAVQAVLLGVNAAGLLVATGVLDKKDQAAAQTRNPTAVVARLDLRNGSPTQRPV